MLKKIVNIKEINKENKFQIIVKTFFGLEDVLLQEMIDLGIENPEKMNRAVMCIGNLETVYKLNYSLRTALKVLIPIRTFTVKNDKQLYKNVYEIDWTKIFSVNQTFAIENSVFSKYFKHSQYAALKTKDAIADQFRSKFDRRPSVELDNPDMRIDLHINNDLATLSLDASGNSLHKRGYRMDINKAPLNEALAAGLLKLTGWQDNENLYDPMCGSGTIIIEAALMLKNIFPGSIIQKFGFESWGNYDSSLLDKVKNNAGGKKEFKAKLFASDIDPKAILIAKQNAKRAGVDDIIDFKVKDFAKTTKPEERCIIIANPPYGKRLQTDDIINLYKTFGDTLKKNYSGCDAWIISGNKDALKFVGLKPSQKYNLYNGPIESKFYKYSLYEGSR